MQIDIYTDGSFNRSTPNEVHGGAYMLIRNGETVTVSKVHFINKDRILTSMNNVGGELLAVVGILRTLIAVAEDSGNPDLFKGKTLNIFHDYSGVADWITGTWAAKNSGTIWYVNQVSLLKSKLGVDLEFHKVKGHSGCEGNTMADMIASYDLNYCRSNGVMIYNIKV